MSMTGNIGVALMPLINVRLERNGTSALATVDPVRAGHERARADAARDLFGQHLAIVPTLRVLRLSRVCQKSTFDQNSRHRCATQDVIAAPADTAIRRRSGVRNRVVDGRGERQTLRTVKVRLDPTGAAAASGIEMDADEDGVSIGVRHRHARCQRHEDIALARHDCAITISVEGRLQPFRNIESHRFFRHGLPGNPTTIMTAMAGIDNNDGRRSVWSHWSEQSEQMPRSPGNSTRR